MGFGDGDIRIWRSGEWLMEQIAATGSLTMRKVGATRAGEVRAHRFLSSDFTSVEAREVDPPACATPLSWRLLTTHAADDAARACEVVRFYRLRWRVEQLFRTLKSDGLKLEDSQIIEADRLMRLAAVALGAAARIIQLVDARDGGPRSCLDVIEANLVEPAEAIGKTLEGKTERQKNPHEKASLAWIAARLGGWNCYYKPPGPKTMRDGWSRLASMLAGYAIAKNEALP